MQLVIVARTLRFFLTLGICLAALGYRSSGQETVAHSSTTQPPACAAIPANQIQADLNAAAATKERKESEARVATLLADYNALGEDCPYRDQISNDIAALALQAGHTDDAERHLRNALSNAGTDPTTPSVDNGLNDFVLGTVEEIRGRYPQAEADFLQAIKFLTPLGNGQALAISGIYQDLGMLYVHIGDLRSADESIQKSLEFQRRADKVPIENVLLVRDAMVHLRFAEGRFSDALKLLNDMSDEYGSRQAVRRNLRAHLHRDAGEIAVVLDRPKDAVTEFRAGMALLDDRADTPGYAVSLATLAQAYMEQKDLQSAEHALADADSRVHGFEENFPEDAAAVRIAYAALLSKEKRWQEARPLLVNSVDTAHDPKTRMNGLKNLIEADHHLHKRSEEAERRRELKKMLAQGETRAPATRDTVDIMALMSNSSH